MQLQFEIIIKCLPSVLLASVLMLDGRKSVVNLGWCKFVRHWCYFHSFSLYPMKYIDHRVFQATNIKYSSSCPIHVSKPNLEWVLVDTKTNFYSPFFDVSLFINHICPFSCYSKMWVGYFIFIFAETFFICTIHIFDILNNTTRNENDIRFTEFLYTKSRILFQNK